MFPQHLGLLQNKIQYVFNRINLNFIKEIKDKDQSLRKKLKENYKVFDKLTDKHITYYLDVVNEKVLDVMQKRGYDILNDENVLSLNVLKGISVSDVVEVVDDSEKDVLKFYLYSLHVLGYLKKECVKLNVYISTTDESDDVNDSQNEENEENEKQDEDEDEDEEHKEQDCEDEKLSVIDLMLTKTLKVINKIDDSKLSTELEEVIDDDLRNMLVNIHDVRKEMSKSLMKDVDGDIDVIDVNDESKDGPDFSDTLEFLNNSKIGELAKEISEDIDISSLNVEKPEDLLNIDDIFSGKNNMLGDIINKVGSRITNKIQSGQIKQDELMNEAFSMMTKLNGTNSFMEDMMKNAMNQGGNASFNDLQSKMKNNPVMRKNNTKNRLQKKLENRKQKDV
jgi:hypothetical protein